jgi:RHS repeat-associated protein
LDVVTFNNALVANFNYDNAGRKVAANFGNGITETRTYQADNLNTSINTPGVTNFAYTWDANKRKLSQTETGIPLNSQTYSYDDEDRLASFNRNNGDNQTWNLSLVGDWNQFNNNGNVENRTHNTVHEMTAVNAVPLTYDVKGNLTGNSNGQVYAWDIENRLTTATDSQNNTLGIYTYDALGRRVSKTAGGNTTIFVSDGLQKICEYENGVLARSYAYGSYIDEPLVMISGANKYYYHSNNLYSVAALTDAAGAVIERYKYDPYGKATILASDGTTTRTASIVNNPFLCDGYYHDTETGLEFVNARYYSSDLGRFIARDPIGYKGGINLYEYVKSKPTKFLDPHGTRTLGVGGSVRIDESCKGCPIAILGEDSRQGQWDMAPNVGTHEADGYAVNTPTGVEYVKVRDFCGVSIICEKDCGKCISMTAIGGGGPGAKNVTADALAGRWPGVVPGRFQGVQ